MFQNYYRLFRIPDPASTAAPPTPAPVKTMADIEAEAAAQREANGGRSVNYQKDDPNDPNKNKPDPNKDKNDPTKFDEKGRALPPEGKMYAADGTSLIDDPNYKKPEDKDKPTPKVPPAGKKYDVDGKTLIDDPDYKPEEEVEEDFWEAVEKHTGVNIKVEYPEGVVPASVEGAALREQAVMEYAIDNWEQQLQTKYPRAFAYMLHHMDGGSDNEFLANERGVSLPERTVVEGSVDVQTTMYKNDLLQRGIDADIVELQVTKAIKDNTLKDKALKVYDSIQKAQKDELDAITARNKAEATRVDNIIKGMEASIDKMIPELGYVVPDAEKNAFKDYFLDNLQYDKRSNTFALVVPIKGDDLKSKMEAMFLQFKGLNLEKIVQKKVQTKAAQILKVKADSTKNRTPDHQSDKKDEKQFIPLGSMGK